MRVASKDAVRTTPYFQPEALTGVIYNRGPVSYPIKGLSLFERYKKALLRAGNGFIYDNHEWLHIKRFLTPKSVGKT